MKNDKKLKQIKKILHSLKAVQDLNSFNKVYAKFCNMEGLTKTEEFLLYYMLYKFYKIMQTRIDKDKPTRTNPQGQAEELQRRNPQ